MDSVELNHDVHSGGARILDRGGRFKKIFSSEMYLTYCIAFVVHYCIVYDMVLFFG